MHPEGQRLPSVYCDTSTNCTTSVLRGATGKRLIAVEESGGGVPDHFGEVGQFKPATFREGAKVDTRLLVCIQPLDDPFGEVVGLVGPSDRRCQAVKNEVHALLERHRLDGGPQLHLKAILRFLLPAPEGPMIDTKWSSAMSNVICRSTKV